MALDAEDLAAALRQYPADAGESLGLGWVGVGCAAPAVQCTGLF